jgi:hypothetical protein
MFSSLERALTPLLKVLELDSSSPQVFRIHAFEFIRRMFNIPHVNMDQYSTYQTVFVEIINDLIETVSIC